MNNLQEAIERMRVYSEQQKALKRFEGVVEDEPSRLSGKIKTKELHPDYFMNSKDNVSISFKETNFGGYICSKTLKGIDKEIYLGKIVKNVDSFVFITNQSKLLESNDLREIADKVDELNQES
jgi:hypothetical protein